MYTKEVCCLSMPGSYIIYIYLFIFFSWTLPERCFFSVRVQWVTSRIWLSSGSLQPLVVEISSFLDEKDCQHIIGKALPHIEKSAVKHMDHEPWRWHFWSQLGLCRGDSGWKWSPEKVQEAMEVHAFHFRILGCWKARCRVENQQHIFYAIWWLLLACSDLAFVICTGKGWHYRKLTQLPSTGVCKSTPS